MIIVKDMAQGSKEWLNLRLGIPTASGLKYILNFGSKSGWKHEGCDTWHGTEDVAIRCKRGGAPVYAEELTSTLSAQRSVYRNKLLAEWATGAPVEDWLGNEWTERGLELEGEAAAYFSMHTGFDVESCAFIYRDDTKTAGASPDMLVINDAGEVVAGLELKCPKASTHVGYLLDGRNAYEEQVQFSLWASQLPAWWFMSYHPDLPPYLERITPLSEYQSALDREMPVFLREIERGKQRLKEIGVNGV